MSNENTKKRSKLTLGKSKLTLNKKIDSESLLAKTIAYDEDHEIDLSRNTKQTIIDEIEEENIYDDETRRSEILQKAHEMDNIEYTLSNDNIPSSTSNDNNIIKESENLEDSRQFTKEEIIDNNNLPQVKNEDTNLNIQEDSIENKAQITKIETFEEDKKIVSEETEEKSSKKLSKKIIQDTSVQILDSLSEGVKIHSTPSISRSSNTSSSVSTTAKTKKVFGNKETSKEVTPAEILKNLEEEENTKTNKKSASKSTTKKKVNKASMLDNLSKDEDDEGNLDIPSQFTYVAPVKKKRISSSQSSSTSKSNSKIYKTITLSGPIIVRDLANKMSEKTGDVVKILFKNSIMAKVNDEIDIETAELVANEMNHEVIIESEEERMNNFWSNDNLTPNHPRPPVVTVMGHVDHGKTSLLDAMRKSNLVSGEAGGITQHIGAYDVQIPNKGSIIFIDTPGHEAFTAMRLRGVNVTDIVILVVAADDSINTQTIEAINHAQAAEVPIIVAINKIDKDSANIEKVKNDLLKHSIISEDLGGDTIIVPVSAKNHTNLDKLQDAILLQAEMLELKTDTEANSRGVVIEARLDKFFGNITTLLISHGELQKGQFLVSGSSYGKVKTMKNSQLENITSANAFTPVEITGFETLPSAGDSFVVVDSEKVARDIAKFAQSQDQNFTNAPKMSFDSLMSQKKELHIIIKSDVQGTVEAITASIEKLNVNDENVEIKIIHSGIGAIKESDIMLASVSNAIIYAFNVRPESGVKDMAENEEISIRLFSVIYHLIEDIESLLSGMQEVEISEKEVGQIEVRKVISIPKVGKIAGCFVRSGYVKNNSHIRVIRDGVVIYTTTIDSLKRFTEDVQEVKTNYECGIMLKNYSDLKENDSLEVFEMVDGK